MNEYKINVTEVIKKQIIVKATNPKEALDIIQNNYMKSNSKEFKNKDLFEVNAKIIEENGKNIEENEKDNDNKLEEIDERLTRMEHILGRMIKLEKYIDEKMDFIKDFAEKAVELLQDIDNTIDESFDFLNEESEENIE